MIIGVSAPPEEQDERSQRRYVFLWLGAILVVLLLCTALFFLIPRLYSQ